MRFGTLGPPHAQEPIGEAIRNRQLEEARRAGWPELDREDLIFGRHFVEHKPSGDLYRIHRGVLVDGIYTATAAFFMSNGEIVFLERPTGGLPQTRAELEQRRAGQAKRRNEPKPHRKVKRR